MAVAEDGSYAGSFSGGCIEAAVVAEALEALSDDRIREVRFGAGSPYIDIRLPCGGSVDLLFNPLKETSVIDDVLTAMRARRPISITLPRHGGDPALLPPAGKWGFELAEDRLDLHYIPPLRLAIFGDGSAVEALERAAHTYGADVSIFTPDEAIIARAADRGSDVTRLVTPERFVDMRMDRWTAAIFLFHDHDWELALLQAALEQSPFFAGAMGSRVTHQHRLGRLRDMGMDDKMLEQIVAPIGLIASTRDPETLSLSILIQVVADYHQRFMNLGA